MRTTPTMQYGRFLESLRTIKERIAASQSQIASGRRLEKPSDDPIAAGEALRLRSAVSALDRFSQNSGVVRGYLNVTDSALSSLGDLVTSARAEAIRGASETTGTSRDQIAITIDSIREQVFTLARTRYQGRYVFSGTDTQTNPYDGSGNYLGNSGGIQVEVGDGETTTANITGTQVFGAGAGIFGVLANLSTALRAGDTAAIQAAADSIEALRAQLSSARTIVGERIVRVDAAAGRSADARVSLLGRLSDLESADLAGTITQLSNDQVAQQSVLATGARIGQRSLFDYLG